MARKILPDADYLRECFYYTPATGELRWKSRPRSHFPDQKTFNWWNNRFAGHLAATQPSPTNHGVVGLNGISYYAHRIIWKLVTAEEPPEIDHKDLNGMNNRWDNLRPATRRQNMWNKKVRSDSDIGLKGVRLDKRSGRFGATICVDGKQKWLGTFATKEDAHAAYCAQSSVNFGEFSRHN